MSYLKTKLVDSGLWDFLRLVLALIFGQSVFLNFVHAFWSTRDAM